MAQRSSNFRNTYKSQYVELPLDQFKAAAEARQRAYDLEVKDCQNQVNEVYESITSFRTITPGWHNVNILGLGVCDETKALVEGGKVTQIVRQNGDYLPITVSTPLQNGRCTITIKSEETSQPRFFKLVFLEELMK